MCLWALRVHAALEYVDFAAHSGVKAPAATATQGPGAFLAMLIKK